jgi:TetR/AcrR family transcriptional regulator, tetracycline repressor protein
VALDRERIVTEAVALLDEAGLDGLTFRKLAARLGVQAPTLYWHVKNKAALVNAVAEAILVAEFGTIPAPAAGESWQAWLTGIAWRLRRAMLAHPDGARVVSAGQLSATMADVSEAAITALVSQGVPLRRARLTVLAVERFTIGHVLEEQAPRPDAEALTDFDLTEFSARHPAMIAAITDYFHDGRDVDSLFRDTLAVIVPL